MSLDKTVDIGTDIASFFLFHPDDLAHRKADPATWYLYGFACRKEFEAGNLVAFRTGGDGGYQLRITSGDLTDAERAVAAGSWEWGYTVRHGKVIVDNGDYLPSEEQFDIAKAQANQWVEVPSGDYRVTVYPIERRDNSLPDYVIRFEPVDKVLHIARSASLPDLLPARDIPPQASSGISADEVWESKQDNKPLAPTYPLIVAEGQAVLPGGSTSVVATNELFEAVQSKHEELIDDNEDIYVVFAPSDTVPGMATLAWVNGWSQLLDNPGRIKLRGECLVRIMGRTEGKLLPRVHVEPVPQSNEPLGKSEVKALQTAFEQYADRHVKDKNAVSSFDREWITAMTTGTALTRRLLELIPMLVETQLRLQGASDTERAKELTELLGTV